MVGCHQLLLLNLYPFLQKYMQPHQAEVPTILAVLVQVSAIQRVCARDTQAAAFLIWQLRPEALFWQLQQSQQHVQKYIQPPQAEVPTIPAVLVQVSPHCNA